MMQARFIIVVSIASCLTAALSGCPPTAQVVSSSPPRVDQADSQVAGCLVAKDPLNPFIVEWPGTEKVALEVASKEGLVAVSYVSCYLKVLRGCKGVGAYEVREANAAVDGFEITNQSDLYARLPLGAANLQAELSSGNGLRLNYLATGQKVAKTAPQKFEGDCASATHYVRAMTVGAYSLDAMSSGSAGAGAGVGGIGAGSGRKETQRRIRGQGNIEQCQITGLATKGCDAVLQLELAPIAGVGPTAAYAPLPRAEGAGAVAPAPAWQPQTPTAPSVDDLKRLKDEAALIQKAVDEAKARADAEDRRRREAEAKAKAEYLARCEEGWKAASETANMTAVAAKTRIGALKAFLDRFKTDNPHEAEARECIANIELNSQKRCPERLSGSDAFVTIELESTPTTAEIYRGQSFIGITPAKIRGKRGDEDVLTFKEPRCVPQTITVRYDKARVVRVELEWSGGAVPPSPEQKELYDKIDAIRNPFR
jgi:hypothetical protein